MNYNIGINNGDVINNINNNNSESNRIIDHLVITVHGIGKHEEKWNEKIIKMNTVYQNVTKITERNKNVKFVGLEWHSGVHKKTDQFIKKVTPNSIPKVRELINHTLLDILLFTSPAFSQHIYTEVGTKLNSIYKEFLESNPTFKGKVSILAHSLGSVICYDILCHQLNSISKIDSSTDSTTADYGINTSQDKGNIFYWKKLRDEQLKQQLKQSQQSQQQQQSSANNNDNDDTDDDDDTDSCGSVDVEEDLKKCLLGVNFPKLEFDVFNLYCIGSPIGLFCTVRGHQFIDIPKCINLYNIYDQSDPVASLLEPLVDEGFQDAGESLVATFSSKKKLVNRNSQNVSSSSSSSTVISSSSSSSSSTTTTIISNNNNNNTSSTTSTITTTTVTSNNNNNSGNNSPNISMFSKFTSKLNSVIGKNSNTSTTTTTNSTITQNETPNNSVLQLTTQKPSPSSSFIMVEETEMSSFDGASSGITKRTSSFNGSSIPSSDSEFDDTSSEKSDKGEKSSYNLYIENQQLDSTPKKLIVPNKSLPMTPQQQQLQQQQPQTPSTPSSTTTTTTTSNARFFGGYRFDYKLKQTGVLSQLSDYSSVFNAHKSYWLSNDVMYFINSSL